MLSPFELAICEYSLSGVFVLSYDRCNVQQATIVLSAYIHDHRHDYVKGGSTLFIYDDFFW